MLPVLTLVKSSVGKKLVMAITALSLVMFVVVHLIGNLQLLRSSSSSFNAYAHKLEGLGGVLYIAELGLLGIFITHFMIAITIVLKTKKARPIKYFVTKDLGGTSHKSLGSSTMIYTGIVMLVFIVVHLINFKFGPGIREGYVKLVHGQEVRDLHRLVVEWFSKGWYVAFYTAVMTLLLLHLRHGFWSAFQSLGMNHAKYNKFIFAVGIFIAVAFSLGFLFIPIFIYFTGSIV